MVEKKRFTTMPVWLERVFIKFRADSEFLDYGRDIVVDMVKSSIESKEAGSFNILDIGAGKGVDLMNIKNYYKNIDIKLYAVDCDEKNISILKKEGISSHCLSIEKNSLPFLKDSQNY